MVSASSVCSSLKNCTVREWLATLQEEALSMECAALKLEKSIKILNVVNPSLVGKRNSQLEKMIRALEALELEIQAINSTCAKCEGPDCGVSSDSIFSKSSNCTPPICDSKCLDCASAGECSKCSGNWNSSTCSVCKEGWTGSTCSTPICDSKCLNCSSPGNCSICSIGWIGSDCNTPVCDSKCSSCASPGNCSICFGNWIGSTCSLCKNGWTGSTCSTPICDSKCLNCSSPGNCSACVGNWNGTICSNCKTGWNGTNCSSPVCDIKCLTCALPGQCSACFGNWIGALCSSCKTGFGGSDCNSPVCDYRCTSCSSPGVCSTCSGNWHGPTCSECKIGWTISSGCTIPINVGDLRTSTVLINAYVNRFMTDVMQGVSYSNGPKLLYRASRDGYGASAFHSKCDDKGANIVLVKASTGAIFGGYSSVSWTSVGSYGQDSLAFLFSLLSSNREERFKKLTQNYGYLIENHHTQFLFSKFNINNYGPTFGGGNDLHIADNCDTYNSQSQLCHSYCDASMTYQTTPAQTYLAGVLNFIVSDYEVYSFT